MLSLFLESAARSLGLAVMVWVGLRLCRIKTPQVRSQVWTAVLLSAVTMPVLMQLMKIVIALMPTSAAVWIPVTDSPFFLRPLAAISNVSPPSSFEWSTLALMLYGIIASWFLLRLLSGLVSGRRLRKSSVPLEESWTRGSDVRVSPELAIPVTCGSTILLPADWREWSTFKREAVLLHEQSHVRRRDFYVHFLASLHRAVFWFTPLGWWLERELLDLAEQSCDDDAIRKMKDPVSYAEVLVELAKRQSRTGLVVLAMARGKTVERRVERALRETPIILSTSPLRRTVFAASVVLLIGLAAGSRLVDAETVFPPAPVVSQAPPQTPQATQALAAWPAQEVPDIITDEERAAFGNLRVDVEREQFIRQFWLRRDPSPGTTENEFRDEYYRRIAVANQPFTTGAPGWLTDRGRISIRYGLPDEIETHAQTATASPFEAWRYRFIEGIGANVILEFVDAAGNGDYRLRSPSDLILKPIAAPAR